MKEESIIQVSELCSGIGATANLRQLGNLLVDRIKVIFSADKISLMLLDKEKNELFIWASSDLGDEQKEVKVKYGQMFAGWVAEKGQPLLVKNVDSEFPHLSKIKLGRYKSKSFIIAPIKDKDKTLGVINITERKDLELFDEEDLKLISLIIPALILQMEKIQLIERIENLSTTDSLTGLSSHRYFQEHLSEEIDRAQRYRRRLSLIIIDVDNFQEYNEHYGYAMGDKVLTQLANILLENLRKVDIIARYAGEEFVIILPDTKRKQAALAAEKLRDKVNSAVFVERRNSSLAMARLTVSLGVAEYNMKDSKEEFIKKVVLALEEAKEKGRNRVCVYR